MNALIASHTLDFTAPCQRAASTPGPIRLGSWTATPARGGRSTFEATFGIGDTIVSASATTYGPIDALTSMLYDAGIHLEITSFHQHDRDGRVTTFVECEHDGRRHRAAATDDNGATSSIRAIIGAANGLHP